MASTFAPPRARIFRCLPSRKLALRLALGASVACAGVVLAVGPARLIAQIEGDRGIAPVVTSGDIEINGINVEATGKTGQEAKANGLRMAYKQAWAQAHGPDLSPDQLESLVSAVTVEQEEIGPHHYRARLGITFDRARAGQFVGAGGVAMHRSPPMLIIPVLYSGGVAQVYEVRGPWQRAWAEFRIGGSAIDYVRPNGGGGDSLVINAGQPGRRSRVWWRELLDQFGASDVLMPEARLERQWPGGPVKATFTARYGTDNRFLATFDMTAPDDGAVPAMLAQAVERLDQIYADAFQRGVLRPDPTLSIEHPQIDPALQRLIEAGHAAEAAEAAREAAAAAAFAPLDTGVPVLPATPSPAAEPVRPAGTVYNLQVATPDARAVDAAVAALRSAPGLEGVATTSLALGGTSVVRVTFAGSLNDLAAALRARGWQVSVAGTVLRIKR